jgi:glyoxylase-like metal-dependent hydrolase (beta-lactamase superfamily II)
MTVRHALACLLFIAGAPARADGVAPGVTLVPGAFTPGSQPDGNSVLIDAPDGIIVVDTGRHPAHLAAILDAVAATRKPVAAVVNTHWHLDHIGQNPGLRKAFPRARVYASGALAEARKGFLARYQKQLEELVAGEPDAEKQKPFRAELAIIAAGDALAPDETVTTSGRRRIAGRELDVHLETHAVTAGDVWLYDPQTRTLVAGDLVTLPVPFLDTACPRRWLDALDHLAAVDFAVLVPGHGPPMKRADLETYRAAFAHLVACAAAKQDAAACIAGWQKDAAPLLAGADPKVVTGMLDYYLKTALAGDVGRDQELCATR